MDAIRTIFVFILLGVSLGHAQEYETISWHADKKLKWSDFKAKPQQRGRIAAVTASGITYKFSSLLGKDKVEIDFTVSTHFYPRKSWYHPELCDAFILAHEQHHFDISELYARKMRRILRETKFTKNVKAEVGAIYRDIIKALDAYQKKYDAETNFSRNADQQRIWNKRIEEALAR
ncbi:DUF922 domain-containing protein [Spongiimicrobium sp. 3-5]|uniref:DUF922 domain-containing protein n=1 Tax=Spongiimicrobium sp. 3-5 TaxID=3332596 RepID=UPI0039814641